MGTSAPKFSCTGSHSAVHRKRQPYLFSESWLPMTSEIRIAASRLKTSSAKNRVSCSKAASSQPAEGALAGSTDSEIGRTALTHDPRILVERLAGRVLELRFPARLDLVDHRVGQRHVVELFRHGVAFVVGPIEELEHFSRVLRLFLRFVHQDEGR